MGDISLIPVEAQLKAYLSGNIFEIGLIPIRIFEWSMQLLVWLRIVVTSGPFPSDIVKYMLGQMGFNKVPTFAPKFLVFSRHINILLHKQILSDLAPVNEIRLTYFYQLAEGLDRLASLSNCVLGMHFKSSVHIQY